MNYEAVEQSIVTRLNSPLTTAGFDVQSLPEKETDYKTPSQKPKVWVAYSKSKFDQISDDPRILSTGSTVQKEVLNIELTIQSTKLRGNAGIFKGIELVRKRLIGFEPTNCNKLYMIQVMPQEYKENLWTYTVIMGCYSMVVEEGEDEQVPDLKMITLDNEPYNEEWEFPQTT